MTFPKERTGGISSVFIRWTISCRKARGDREPARRKRKRSPTMTSIMRTAEIIFRKTTAILQNCPIWMITGIHAYECHWMIPFPRSGRAIGNQDQECRFQRDLVNVPIKRRLDVMRKMTVRDSPVLARERNLRGRGTISQQVPAALRRASHYHKPLHGRKSEKRQDRRDRGRARIVRANARKNWQITRHPPCSRYRANVARKGRRARGRILFR